MSALARNSQGFVAGSMIGTLGGLIGLGGAEFRLPVLVGVFRFGSLEAVILNKAMSLVVVAAALLFRGGTIAPGTLANHLDVVLNLLAGSLVGAWWAAGHAITLPRQWLNRIILVLLVGLALVMLSEAWAGVHEGSTPLFEAGALLWMAGLIAGLGIGMVAALLGVAGGELLIPVIVLLYGLDIKLAGSLSLMVSLPTMIVGFARYTRAKKSCSCAGWWPVRSSAQPWAASCSAWCRPAGFLACLVSSCWSRPSRLFSTRTEGQGTC